MMTSSMAGVAGQTQGGGQAVCSEGAEQGSHHPEAGGEAHHVRAQHLSAQHQASLPCWHALLLPDEGQALLCT